MNKLPVIILTGPTAVGKTALSIKLAQQLHGEIISADSMQVYKYMDIGTAKITKQEQQDIPHHLIDILEPEETFHVVKFQQLAQQALQDIYQRGKIPIVVGGTGFYIQALIYDIDFTEAEVDITYRRELEELAHTQGADNLHRRLQIQDPMSAKEIHPNNIKKVIRALEYYKVHASSITLHNQEQREKFSPFQSYYFVLNDDRDCIYQRINDRVDYMIAQGLVEEVNSLMKRGLNLSHQSMQGIGYKQIYEYLIGESTLEEAIYRLKRDSRHFAKRQLTWFRREREVIWLDRQRFQEDHQILKEIHESLRDLSVERNI